jgi:glycosyltransferase involved in cell wall biosynthesis
VHCEDDDVRISWVLPPDAQTGGMRVIATYAARLAARGHIVTALQPRHPRPSLRAQARSFVRRRIWLRNFNHDPSYFDQLERALPNGHHPSAGGRFQRIQLPHCGPIANHEMPPGDVVIATWWETAEWVQTFTPDKGAWAYLVQHYEAHIPMQPVDRVDATWRAPLRKIVVAQWLADLARDRFAEQAGDTIVIPNAADTDLFFADPRGKQPQPTIGFMYSEAPFKGSDIALEALRLAARSLPAINVVCFGLDPLPPALRALLPANTRFFVRPTKEVLRQCYSACDAWLFASRVEGFGLPILEAMACRTPVIGTPAGAAPDLLGPAGGILVPMENPQAMADAILQIAAMPEEQWIQRSRAAYQVATRYTWDHATDQFESALRDISALTPSGRPA